MSGPHPILADYLTLFQSNGRGEGRLNLSSQKILTFRWPCNQSTAAQTRGRGEGSHFPFWWHASSSSSSSSSWKASWRQFRFTLEAKKIAAWLAIQFLGWESFLPSAAMLLLLPARRTIWILEGWSLLQRLGWNSFCCPQSKDSKDYKFDADF